jgi:flagellar assembly protein FliH
MAKRVFKVGEMEFKKNHVVLDAPFKIVEEEVTQEEDVQVYTGPTVEELQAEADRFREQWDEEKSVMMENSREEAEQLVVKAQEEADQILEDARLSAEQMVKDGEQKAADIQIAAEKEAVEKTEAAQKSVSEVTDKAREEGYQSGYSEGFEKGRVEVERVLNKLQVMLSAVVDRRNDILKETESEVVDLVLQISNKVVKVISEAQRDVVISNVRSALKKLKSKTDIIIRVNTQDLDITNEKAREFLESVENVKHVTVVEDALVDAGGCIVETDKGEIDARIKSQLRQIEKAILDLAPIGEEK